MTKLKMELTKSEYENFSNLTQAQLYTELQMGFLPPRIVYGLGFSGASKPYQEKEKYYIDVMAG